jgi:hypothetical protein
MLTCMSDACRGTASTLACRAYIDPWALPTCLGTRWRFVDDARNVPAERFFGDLADELSQLATLAWLTEPRGWASQLGGDCDSHIY